MRLTWVFEMRRDGVQCGAMRRTFGRSNGGREKDFFLFCKKSRLALGSAQPHSQWVSAFGCKAAGAWRVLPSRISEGNNEWLYIPPPYCFMPSCLDRDKLTFRIILGKNRVERLALVIVFVCLFVCLFSVTEEVIFGLFIRKDCKTSHQQNEWAKSGNLLTK